MSKAVRVFRTESLLCIILICLLTVSFGCRHRVSGPVLINRVVIYNHSGVLLEEIALVNPRSAQLAGCSRLDPDAVFEVGFCPRPYTEDSPVLLRWECNGKPQQQVMPPFRLDSGVQVSDIPAFAVIVIEFRSDGTIHSGLKQTKTQERQ